MVKFLSLEEVYQTKSGSLKQTATLRLSDDLKVRMSYFSCRRISLNQISLGEVIHIIHPSPSVAAGEDQFRINQAFGSQFGDIGEGLVHYA